MTCEGIGITGTCPEGKIPALTGGNAAFWRVFQLALPGLVRPDGYDYGALRVVFDACRVPRHLREIYMGHAMAIIEVITKLRIAARENRM